jgi:hypothetical protein
MKLLEVSTLEELTPAHVTQLTRLVPLGRQEATARALAEA